MLSRQINPFISTGKYLCEADGKTITTDHRIHPNYSTNFELTKAELLVNLLITLIVKCDVISCPDLSAVRRKIKIELEDENGEKYNLTLQGTLTREKLMNVMEFIQLFDKNSIDGKYDGSIEGRETDTKLGSKLWNLIIENFRYHTFTSSDILRIYHDLYYESIQLSVISIYLSRFYFKKQLNRSKNGKQWVYTLIKQNISNFRENYEKPNDSNLLSVPTVYDLRL
ncbi:MAG TPA: hypothetical protein VJ772_02505 [Nitrososphaeraceae archaeon]|nr:hypothetical protein [Nitrososphaeraceae archaeon]